MIEAIKIASIATYSKTGIKINNIPHVNYIFGHNGCGKTTISRVIQNPSDYPDCSVSWKDNIPLKTLVYNSDFINKNFDQDLDGIFTIGEDNVETQSEIKILLSQVNILEEERLKRLSDIKNADVESGMKKKNFQNEIWNYKKKYEKFKQAFTGYNNNKDKFFEELFERYKNDLPLGNEDFNSIKNEFETKYSIAFENNLNPYKKINYEYIYSIAEKITSYEENEILSQPITLQNASSLSNLIQNLNNSDWVHQGIPYLNKTEGFCPFCQQEISSLLQRKIEEIFDNSYETACQNIQKIKSLYQKAINEIIIQLDNFNKEILKMPLLNERNLFPEKIERIKKALSINTSKNLILLEDKIKNPSKILNENNLEKTNNILKEFLKYIISLNELIDQYNKSIESRKNISEEVKNNIWRIMIKEKYSYIENYEKEIKK